MRKNSPNRGFIPWAVASAATQAALVRVDQPRDSHEVNKAIDIISYHDIWVGATTLVGKFIGRSASRKEFN